MTIIRTLKNTLLRWKTWGALTVIVLALSYTLGTHSVVQIIGGYYILSEASSYAGYALFWLSILSFTYAWFSSRIKFPKFLTKRIVASLVPLMIITYIHSVMFAYEEFAAFYRYPEPFFTISDPLIFIFLRASFPFYSLFDEIGLWSFGGPTNIGSFLIATIYSVAIYGLWSVTLRLFRKRLSRRTIF